MGNVSIQVVSVSLVQVFRAIIPGVCSVLPSFHLYCFQTLDMLFLTHLCATQQVTMLLAYLILGKRSSFLLILSMIPICFGVMLTVSGELDLGYLGYCEASSLPSNLHIPSYIHETKFAQSLILCYVIFFSSSSDVQTTTHQQHHPGSFIPSWVLSYLL